MRMDFVSPIRAVWRGLNSKLFYKMVILYSLLTVIPLTIVSTTFYLRSKSTFESKLLESRNQTLVETADKIDVILKTLSDKIKGLSDNRVIIGILQNDKNPRLYPMKKEERKLLEGNLAAMLNFELTGADPGSRYIDAIYVYNEAGDMYATEGALKPEYFLALTIMPFSQRGKPEWAFFVDRSRLVCSIQIIDFSTYTTLGYLSIMLKPEAIHELYASYPNDTFYITNGSNVILSSGDPKKIGGLFQTGNSKDIVVNRRVSLYSGFVYVNVVARSELYREIIQLGKFAAVTTVVSLGIVLLLTFIILKRITRPLRKLTLLMRKAEKEVFEPIKGLKSYDEIGLLGESFNSLIAEIRDLIDKVYKAEVYKKEAEIKAIKMHMNPHFLYNTLETIGIVAKSPEGIAVVPEMVQTLSRILRFSITPGNDYIALKTEIHFARSYMQLHQYRLGDRLSFSFEVPEELLPVKVPKLILQPLVENAVIHGVSQLDRNGVITVSAYEKDYDLILEVRDNGPGMQPNAKVGNDTGSAKDGATAGTAAGDMTACSSGATKQGLGTGLVQLESRIKLLYGSRYGMSVEQSGVQGTVIRLVLPMTLMEE